MLPDGVSMLWEDADADLQLSERFGFDGLADVTAWCAATLAARWRIGVLDCTRVVMSDQNAIIWVGTDRGRLVVKWSRAQDRFLRLDAAARVVRGLNDQGIPVATPTLSIDSRARELVAGPSGPLSVMVVPELTGSWLDVQDAAAVRAAGVCLARLHDALRTGGVDPVLAAGPVIELKQRVGDWLSYADPVVPAASRRLGELLADARELSDTPQLVHNDFRAANILTRDSTITGVFDFDELLLTHRVHDLAKASVYLGTRFTDWTPTMPAARAWFVDGYQAVRRLDSDELRWLDILTLWFGLLAIPADDTGGWADAVRVSGGAHVEHPPGAVDLDE